MADNKGMIQVSIAELKAKFSYFLGLAEGGERVVICKRNRPIAELVEIDKPVDVELRKSAFGLFAGLVTKDHLEEALRPMTDEEADAFISGEPGVIGILKGKFTVPDDIDAPLPDDLVDLFEGKAD